MSGILQTLIASLGGVITDAYFNLVTLLLPGNGTNGAQNNTFLDSSSNAFSITRNGNTTQGTFSPFSQTGWSNYFDGSSSYLTATGAASLGSGNFTVECFYYATASPQQYNSIFSNYSTYSSTVVLLYFNGNDNKITAVVNGTDLKSTNTLSLNKWYHVALVRNSGTVTLYIDGVSQATLSYSGSASGNGNAYIGTAGDSPTTTEFTGYISNFRIVIGSAVYTSGFTPPTAPLTAITNTSLLICQSNRFIDNSSNAYAITVNGTPSVQAFSPFAPTAAYSAATVGGSGYFDGTGDYLSIANSTAMDLGSGDFTIEGWWYPTTNTNQNIIAKWWTGGSQWVAQWRNTGAFRFAWNSSSTADFTTTLPLNAWCHFAFVKSGSNINFFFNGVKNGATGTIGALTATTDVLTIGQFNNNSTEYLTGFLSSVRVVKGTAVYSATFTPPTAPLTDITNTQLLLNYTNAGITDATAKNDLETVGNAQISTTQSKFGGSSMYFDGTGDYLTSNSGTPDLYAFNSGDFTIEMWIRFNVVNTIQAIYDGRPLVQGAYPLIYLNSDGTIRYYVNSADRITSSAVSANTWYHIAVSRSGTSTKLFIDGTQSGSTYTDSTIYQNGAGRPWIGANAFVGSGTQSVNGYIDDLRITKGYARYTSNFTAPTAAFALQ